MNMCLGVSNIYITRLTNNDAQVVHMDGSPMYFQFLVSTSVLFNHQT